MMLSPRGVIQMFCPRDRTFGKCKASQDALHLLSSTSKIQHYCPSFLTMESVLMTFSFYAQINIGLQRQNLSIKVYDSIIYLYTCVFRGKCLCTFVIAN